MAKIENAPAPALKRKPLFGLVGVLGALGISLAGCGEKTDCQSFGSEMQRMDSSLFRPSHAMNESEALRARGLQSSYVHAECKTEKR